MEFKKVKIKEAKAMWVDGVKVYCLSKVQPEAQYLEITEKSEFKNHTEFFVELEEGDISVGDIHNFLEELNKKALVTVAQGNNRFKIDSFYVVEGVILLNVIPEEIGNESEISTVNSLLQLIVDESTDKSWKEFNYWDDVEVKIFIGDNPEDDSDALLIKSMQYDKINNEAIITVGEI